MWRTLNFLAYLAACAAATFLYVKSVGPAQMGYEKVKDPYALCRQFRTRSIVAKVLAFLFFILNRYLPLATVYSVPFRWPQWLLFSLALLLGIPGLTLMITGLQDLGSESYAPDKTNKLITSGIYRTIRHPQSYEALLWPAIALGLNSQLMLALSALWIPLGIIMAMAEETDLVIRFGEPYIKYRAKTGMFFPKGKPGSSFLSSIMGFFAGLFSSDDN
jgi:protein-S-isoprenylcysteine O-methyltransferase Ste14